jgi:hypothetical protein
VTKTLVEKLLFKHDIKPLDTNVDQWNIKKCKMPINIKYPIVICMIYQKEKMNYMSNKNALTFMKVEGIKVDWAYIIFNNLHIVSWIDRQKCRKRCR